VRIGLSVYDLAPRDVVDLARDAEAAGFAGVWLGEHVVAPRGYTTPHPRRHAPVQQHTVPVAHESVTLVDPLATLAAAGHATTRLELATGVYVAPLRHPLAVARAVCTLQDLCGGRFVLGLGAGWLREEFAALAVPFAGRFRRLEECVDILREALAGGWISRTEGEPAFDDVMVTREPVDVPIVLGGNADGALRRAARLADGWFSSGTPTLAESLELRDALAAACDESGRTAPLRTWFRMPGADPAELDRYRAEGFEDVLLWAGEVWPAADVQGRAATLRSHAAALGLTPS
jgi:probable F420-dependent oxidoreductase